MKPARLAALLIGGLLLLPGIGLLLAGAGLGSAYVLDRDDDGYITDALAVSSSTAAVTTADLELIVDPGTPDWLSERLEADVRIDVSPTASGAPVFVGIAPAGAVDAFLAGVAHDAIVSVDSSSPEYRRSPGTRAVAAPGAERLWAASADGAGLVRLDWAVAPGRWAVVLMNADGSPGVAADVTVGAKAGPVLPLAAALLGVGAAATASAVLLLVIGAHRHEHDRPAARQGDGARTTSGDPHSVRSTSPVRLEASLDPGLSRWMWLVKWALALPHLLVLSVLWLAFTVLTAVAGVAVLVTGRYPRFIFDFNLGVLRWSWRVSCYATTGGMSTDRYPPFTLGPTPDYPATLDIAYSERLANGLVLVKWLLAVPHLIIVSLFAGSSMVWSTATGDQVQAAPLGGGLLGVLILLAGVGLLVTGRYPRGLFDLIIGLNRWSIRVLAYVALMTDQYPPFRLDLGGNEPALMPATSVVPRLVDLREIERAPVVT